MSANVIVDDDIERWSFEVVGRGVEVHSFLESGSKGGGKVKLDTKALGTNFLKSRRHDDIG